MKEYDFETNLTNEELLKQYKNQFDLVRYAIQLAENAIHSGRDIDVDTDSENLAFKILAEIATHKERFAPTAKEQKEEEEPQNSGFLQAAKEMKKERRAKVKAA